MSGSDASSWSSHENRIFNDTRGGLGGSEYCAAVVAEAFEKDHDVTIIHHKQQLTKELLTDMFSVRLEQPSPVSAVRALFRHTRTSSLAKASRFAGMAGRGQHALRCLRRHRAADPAVLPRPAWHPARVVSVFRAATIRGPRNEGDARWSPRARFRRWYYDWEWKRRFSSYSAVLGNLGIYGQMDAPPVGN